MVILLSPPSRPTPLTAVLFVLELLPQYHSTTHMTLAAQNGHVDLMEFLYQNGCAEDVNHEDERGMVPMMYAAQQDNMDVLNFLYTHGGEESVTYCRPTDGVR